MLSFSDCQALIEDEIKHLDINYKKPVELYQPIAYILSLGGKRIRPILSLMACNMFSEDVSRALKPAIAIEVFHNFTLVHDDIMDNAALRRNQPTVHAKWDENVAILSGDAMQIVAYQLLCGADPFLLNSLIDIFNNTALEICEGQQFDMNFSLRDNVTMEEYLRMIELKTSVLLAAGLKMGALCAGAPENEAQKLYEFGRNLGLAFQIQDDYLDVYANQESFGKTVGGDIAENKKTFLLIKALELAKGENADILQRVVHNQVTNVREKIQLVKKVYDNLNVPEVTCDKITQFSRAAFECLESVDVADERKKPLRQLAHELMRREK
jgi:geranylgeranyl diphosphate synthase, type II